MTCHGARILLGEQISPSVFGFGLECAARCLVLQVPMRRRSCTCWTHRSKCLETRRGCSTETTLRKAGIRATQLSDAVGWCQVSESVEGLKDLSQIFPASAVSSALIVDVARIHTGWTLALKQVWRNEDCEKVWSMAVQESHLLKAAPHITAMRQRQHFQGMESSRAPNSRCRSA